MADAQFAIADFFPPGSCDWIRFSKKKRPAMWFCRACRAIRRTSGATPDCAGTEDRTPKDKA